MSYCGLVDPRISASDKDVPLQKLANKDDIDMEEKVETAKQLQKHFASIEDDDDYDEEDVEEVGDMDQDDSNEDDQNFV